MHNPSQFPCLLQWATSIFGEDKQVSIISYCSFPSSGCLPAIHVFNPFLEPPPAPSLRLLPCFLCSPSMQKGVVSTSKTWGLHPKHISAVAHDVWQFCKNLSFDDIICLLSKFILFFKSGPVLTKEKCVSFHIYFSTSYMSLNCLLIFLCSSSSRKPLWILVPGLIFLFSSTLPFLLFCWPCRSTVLLMTFSSNSDFFLLLSSNWNLNLMYLNLQMDFRSNLVIS